MPPTRWSNSLVPSSCLPYQITYPINLPTQFVNLKQISSFIASISLSNSSKNAIESDEMKYEEGEETR